MKSFELAGTGREAFGKKAANSVRNAESIPCVVYGGEKTVHFTVTIDSVRKLIYTPFVQLVDLTVDGKTYKAILQDIQFHPVTDAILHIDFYQIFDNKPIIIEIPIVLEGLADGVKQGGKLSQGVRKLKVRGLYTNLPQDLTVNVEELGLGKSILAGALSFENLEILTPKTTVIATVKLTRAARGAAAAAASTGKKK